MDIFEKEVKKLIEKALNTKTEDTKVKRLLTQQNKFGDYSFACFDIAKKKKKNPKEFAKELAKKIKALSRKTIKTKTIKKPKEQAKEQTKKQTKELILDVKAVNGYVNFFVNKSYFFKETLGRIFNEKEKYGSLNLKGKALIEHTSINPNASPHVGRARNAIIGDILSHLLRFHGYKTDVHYYVNDVSKQIALLILGSKGDETFNDLLNLYVGMSREIERNPKLNEKVFKIIEKIESKDPEVIAKLKKLVGICLEGQKEVLEKLGIFYDSFDYESVYVGKDKTKRILKMLKKTGRLKKDIEGREILDESNLHWEFEKEMKSPVLVLTRSDGTGLYVIRDIAYTIDKLKVAPVNIIVLGEDQKLYFKQLSAALELLGHIPPRVVHYSFVLLKTKKGAKKMSTRRGEVILLSDFIKEAIRKARLEIKKRSRENEIDIDMVSEAIGIGAVRYSIAKIDPNKMIVFDWAEALNFEGNSAPYLQYSYARASSILKKAEKTEAEAEEIEEGNGEIEKNEKTRKMNLDFALDIKNFEDIKEEEYKLVKELNNFPEFASNALDKLAPHLLCNYAYNLAKAFNDFYEACPVLQEKGSIKERRIELVKSARIVLKIVLDLLGLPAIESM